MMKQVVAFTIFSVLSVCLLSGQAQQAPSKAEVPKKKGSQENSGVQQLMQRKRDLAHMLLDAIVLEEFNRIDKCADALIRLSEAAEWQVIQTPRYLQYSGDFQEAAEKLGKNARARNLDGSAFAYMSMTLSCVRCHEYIRETRRTCGDAGPRLRDDLALRH
jgi:hypothetical protein